MKVKDILKTKGSSVITIPEDQTVYAAITSLVEHGIGALMVLDKTGQLVGIISERDILRVSHSHLDDIKTILVKDVMTKDVIVGTPDDDLEYVERVMTDNRIRHLPIIAGKDLAGIISIGDVVKSQLKISTVENHYLRDYISGKYPG